MTQVLAGSSPTYGGFAAVVGLLSWLLIASGLILIAAELNVVLARRLWPRSIEETGDHLGRKGMGWGGAAGVLVGLSVPPLLASAAIGAAVGDTTGPTDPDP